MVSFSWNRSRNFGNFSKYPDFYLFLFLPPQRDKWEGRSKIGFGLWYDIKIYLKFEICFLLDEVNVQNSFSELDSFILFCRLFFVNSFLINALVPLWCSIILVLFYICSLNSFYFSSLNFSYTVLAGQINFTYSWLTFVYYNFLFITLKASKKLKVNIVNGILGIVHSFKTSTILTFPHFIILKQSKVSLMTLILRYLVWLLLAKFIIGNYMFCNFLPRLSINQLLFILAILAKIFNFFFPPLVI